jgi:hypothetical protein
MADGSGSSANLCAERGSLLFVFGGRTRLDASCRPKAKKFGRRFVSSDGQPAKLQPLSYERVVPTMNSDPMTVRTKVAVELGIIADNPTVTWTFICVSGAAQKMALAQIFRALFAL